MSGFVRKLQQAVSGGTLSITPSNGTGSNSSNITVSIYEDSGGTPVNAVQANLTYPTTYFQYVSSTNSGGPFTSAVQNSGGSGTVQIAVASLGTSSTGKQLVATVTFTLTAVGSASIAFAAGSAIDRTSDAANILTRTVGTNYVIS